MEIIFKSINVVNYEIGRIDNIVPPDEYDAHIADLISHIKTNPSVRRYQTVSNKTEVIGAILDVCATSTNENFEKNSNIIARRLLKVEKETQEKVAVLKVNVKRGSLIQALLRDKGKYYYLLAKVQHSDFVDDKDFSFKTGFSKDKKSIWKSCLFDLSDLSSTTFCAQIYTDVVAKFWSREFLELVPLRNDELNTKNAFGYIDRTLGRKIKSASKKDYMLLRNAVIVHFRTHDHFDYYQMIEDVFEKYNPSEIADESYLTFVEQLRSIPETVEFDAQFVPDLSSIKARIRKVWKINNSIDIVIKDGVDDFKQTISTVHETNGDKFIKIKIDDDETYSYFS